MELRSRNAEVGKREMLRRKEVRRAEGLSIAHSACVKGKKEFGNGNAEVGMAEHKALREGKGVMFGLEL